MAGGYHHWLQQSTNSQQAAMCEMHVFKKLKDIMIWAILGTSLVSSLLGAWAVYKYGVIQDQIDRLKEENAKYERMRICVQIYIYILYDYKHI